MSRLLVATLLFLVSFSTLPAQFILNSGFEDTTITSSDTVPTHWSADYFGAGFTTDAHSGNLAMVVWNWYHYAKGWISYGEASSYLDGGGLPISITPDKLSGWYKYIYGDNDGALDSAICEVLVYSHQNFTGARDTIAHEYLRLGPISEYTYFEVPIQYTFPGIQADSILIRFISSEGGFCSVSAGNGNCLYLYVDDLEASTVTGLAAPISLAPSAGLYPSPSPGGFRLTERDLAAFPCTLHLYSLSGQCVYSHHFEGPSLEELQPGLPAGNYLWELRARSGQVQRGKWVLAKSGW